MLFRLMSLFLLFSYALGCAHVHEDDESDLVVSYYKNLKKDKTYLGNFGRVYIHTDFLQEGDEKHLAIIRLDELDGTNPLIARVDVRVYLKECNGVPSFYINYSEILQEDHVLPQIFAIAHDACIKIELFRWKGLSNSKENDEVVLAEKFQIRVFDKF